MQREALLAKHYSFWNATTSWRGGGYVTARDPLRVEPQVVLRGHSVRQRVVLPAVPADQHDVPCGTETERVDDRETDT